MSEIKELREWIKTSRQLHIFRDFQIEADYNKTVGYRACLDNLEDRLDYIESRNNKLEG